MSQKRTAASEPTPSASASAKKSERVASSTPASLSSDAPLQFSSMFDASQISVAAGLIAPSRSLQSACVEAIWSQPDWVEPGQYFAVSAVVKPSRSLSRKKSTLSAAFASTSVAEPSQLLSTEAVAQSSTAPG